VAGLRGEDVDAAGGVLYVDGKGGQRAAVPLHPRLGAALAPWVEASSGGRLWPASPHTVSRRAGRILREHGAADRFHQLRHFYGTAVYQATGDLYRAQRALRHASPATTQVYAQLADDALRAAVAAVP
jgi:integrase/recombinase XerD